MGFFSWRTSDTKETIWNCYTNKCKTVYLYCPDGRIIKEPCYDGYGDFGGEDAYVLLAKWNCPEECNDDFMHDRVIGIDIGCYDEDMQSLKYPLKFSFTPGLKYEDLPAALGDNNQGYFDFYDPGPAGLNAEE